MHGPKLSVSELRRQQILKVLVKPMMTKEIAEAIGLGSQSLYPHIQPLIKSGEIAPTFVGRATYYSRSGK